MSNDTQLVIVEPGNHQPGVPSHQPVERPGRIGSHTTDDLVQNRQSELGLGAATAAVGMDSLLALSGARFDEH